MEDINELFLRRENQMFSEITSIHFYPTEQTERGDSCLRDWPAPADLASKVVRQEGETGDTVSIEQPGHFLPPPPPPSSSPLSSRVSSSRSRVLWQMRILKHSHSLTDCQILNNSAHLLSIFFCLTRREAEMTMFCFEWWNKNYVITKYCLETYFSLLHSAYHPTVILNYN